MVTASVSPLDSSTALSEWMAQEFRIYKYFVTRSFRYVSCAQVLCRHTTAYGVCTDSYLFPSLYNNRTYYQTRRRFLNYHTLQYHRIKKKGTYLLHTIWLSLELLVDSFETRIAVGIHGYCSHQSVAMSDRLQNNIFCPVTEASNIHESASLSYSKKNYSDDDPRLWRIILSNNRKISNSILCCQEFVRYHLALRDCSLWRSNSTV